MGALLSSNPFARVSRLFALAAWIACACTAVSAAPSGDADAKVAPDFTLRSAAGPNVRLNELRGQVVLLNFWGNACAVCRQMLPHLAQWQGQYRDAGLVVLAINIDESAQAARATTERLALDCAVLFDEDKAVSRRYALNVLPTSVLIDRDGHVRAIATKDGAADGALERQVQELLKEGR